MLKTMLIEDSSCRQVVKKTAREFLKLSAANLLVLGLSLIVGLGTWAGQQFP